MKNNGPRHVPIGRRAVLKGALDGERKLERLPSEIVREHGLLAWIKGEGSQGEM